MNRVGWIALAAGLALSIALTLLVDGLFLLALPFLFLPAIWPRHQ